MYTPIPMKEKACSKKDNDYSTSGRNVKCQDKCFKPEKYYEKYHDGERRKITASTMVVVITRITSVTMRLHLGRIVIVILASRKSRGSNKYVC
eukprot:14392024-Ditylum_brightwellii.AAC.1